MTPPTPIISWSRGDSAAGITAARQWLPEEILPMLDPHLARGAIANFWLGVQRAMWIPDPPARYTGWRDHPAGEKEPSRGSREWHAWRAALVPSPEALVEREALQLAAQRRQAWAQVAREAGHWTEGFLPPVEPAGPAAEWPPALEARGWDSVSARWDGGVNAKTPRRAAELRVTPSAEGGWCVRVVAPAHFEGRTAPGAEDGHHYAATCSAVVALREAEAAVSRPPFDAGDLQDALDGLPSLEEIITLDDAERRLAYQESEETSWRSRPASGASPAPSEGARRHTPRLYAAALSTAHSGPAKGEEITMSDTVANFILVLGGEDQEMSMIETMATVALVPFIHATAGGRRVSGGSAYSADAPFPVPGQVWVECRPKGMDRASLEAATGCPVVDHHNPGDMGTGIPEASPGESSVGMVLRLMSSESLMDHSRSTPSPVGWTSHEWADGHGRREYLPPEKRAPLFSWLYEPSPFGGEILVWDDESQNINPIPARNLDDVRASGAIDHAPCEACRGDSPEAKRARARMIRVDAETREVSEEQVEGEVAIALALLDGASSVYMGSPGEGVFVQDLTDVAPPASTLIPTGEGAIPGLRLAGVFTGTPYITLVRDPASRGGRVKVVLGGDGPGTPTHGRAAAEWVAWARGKGLVEIYGGDPSRGFGGAYFPEGWTGHGAFFLGAPIA